jgi:hypothetical protein
MVMACLAFVVLATSSQGPFQLIGAWEDWIGTAALLAMGVALLFYQPNKLPDNVIQGSRP